MYVKTEKQWLLTIIDVNGLLLAVKGWSSHAEMLHTFFKEQRINPDFNNKLNAPHSQYYGLTRTQLLSYRLKTNYIPGTTAVPMTVMQTQENFHAGEDLCAWHAIRICSMLATDGDVLRNLGAAFSDVHALQQILPNGASHPFKTTYWLYAAFAQGSDSDNVIYRRYTEAMARATSSLDPSPLKSAEEARLARQRSVQAPPKPPPQPTMLPPFPYKVVEVRNILKLQDREGTQYKIYENKLLPSWEKAKDKSGRFYYKHKISSNWHLQKPLTAIDKARSKIIRSTLTRWDTEDYFIWKDNHWQQIPFSQSKQKARVTQVDSVPPSMTEAANAILKGTALGLKW